MEETLQRLKESMLKGIKKAAEMFIRTLWEYIKEDVIMSAKQSLDLLRTLIKSEAGQAKKDFIVDIILQKIALPVALRPFKWLIRKMLADKIEKAVIDLINKGTQLIG